MAVVALPRVEAEVEGTWWAVEAVALEEARQEHVEGPQLGVLPVVGQVAGEEDSSADSARGRWAETITRDRPKNV